VAASSVGMARLRCLQITKAPDWRQSFAMDEVEGEVGRPARAAWARCVFTMLFEWAVWRASARGWWLEARGECSLLLFVVCCGCLFNDV
jgi:hypothetical protein